jgi:hypothetical protein
MAQATTQRILKQATEIAEDVADRSKHLYKDAVKRLPEGSELPILISTGALILATGAFFLGRAGRRPVRPLIKLPEIRTPSGFDLTPFYRLARLWLIARVVS